ncbi:hypothetical protein Tco_1457497 [Tanacetum coccineum]
MRIDHIVNQKEETYQVILDIIKNSACYNAFLITSDVLEIYMQQFWFTVKKIKKTNFYKFDLDDKKCKVDVELFKKILDIYPRVPNEDFIVPPSEESMITFLYKLGYKGLLNKLSNMFVDHMHQPWRTLAAIINKCLSGKSSSNDRLTKSRMDILWGVFYKKNVNFAELIWEDFQYEIDYRQSKLRRREVMPYPRFTKIIINYFLSQHKSLAKKKHSYINTIKDDGVLNRLKFVGKGEESQVYGLPIPDTMLTDDIKKSEAYQITPKKKSSISADGNIIPEHDVAFELGKSISKAEAKIAKEEIRLHETHERLVTAKPSGDEESNKSDGEPANRPTERRRPSSKLTTLNEGAGIVPKVPDEAKGSSATKVDAKIDWGSEDDSHQSDDKQVNEGEVTWLSTNDEEKANEDDDRSINIEETNDERTDLENGDQEMTDAEKIVVEKLEEEKGDEEKTEEEQANDDQAPENQAEVDIVGTLVTMLQKEKPEVPPTSSSRSLSSNYYNQFLNVSSDTSLVSIIKYVQIQQEIPSVLSALLLDVLVSVSPSQTTTTPTPTPLPTPPIISVPPPVTTTIPDPLPAVIQRLDDLESKFDAWTKVDHSEAIEASV